MVYSNFDWYKCKGYVIEVCNSNYKNNFATAIVSTSIKRDHINSGCVYSNIDNG